MTATRWFSLRRRLLAFLLGGVTAGWLAAMALTYADAHHEIDELFDAQLVQLAQTLLALASEYDDDDDIARLETDHHKYQKKYAFQLWDNEGRLLLRSMNAPHVPFTSTNGFSDVAGDGESSWRTYSQWDRERQLQVQVAENHGLREALAGHIAVRLLIPALLGLPLLGAWIWFVTRRSLQPVDAIAAEVAGRASDHLEPLQPHTAPVEIAPLLDAINALFGRVTSTLDAERRFTADAAHELRTPLAAILAQAEVAQRARNDEERERALAQIAAGSRRASRLVEQLLTLARLDPAAGIAKLPLRLDQLTAEVCADHGPAALEKNIAFELEAPAAVTIAGNADLLRILLRNLLDNALRYSTAGGRVVVGVTASRLTIADSGPGIPPEDRQNVLQRFHRLAGQETQGSGLGLSIVARIVELHGAQLALDDAGATGGLAVRVDFPGAGTVGRRAGSTDFFDQ